MTGRYEMQTNENMIIKTIMNNNRNNKTNTERILGTSHQSYIDHISSPFWNLVWTSWPWLNSPYLLKLLLPDPKLHAFQSKKKTHSLSHWHCPDIALDLSVTPSPCPHSQTKLLWQAPHEPSADISPVCARDTQWLTHAFWKSNRRNVCMCCTGSNVTAA